MCDTFCNVKVILRAQQDYKIMHFLFFLALGIGFFPFCIIKEEKKTEWKYKFNIN